MELAVIASPEGAFLMSAGDLLAVLDVSKDNLMLPTTYGQLQPPLGVHRLKVRLGILLLALQSENFSPFLVNFTAFCSS